MFDPYSTNHPIKINPYGAALDVETRDLAIKSTDSTIEQLVAMMRKHDLPAETLPTVCRIYESHAAAHGAGFAHERAHKGPILPFVITSKAIDGVQRDPDVPRDGLVKPRSTWQIPQRFQRPCEIVEMVVVNPERWTILDMTIGNKTQFPLYQSLPATVFMEKAFRGEIKFEPVQVAMDVVMIVQYDGEDPNGEVFEARGRVRQMGIGNMLPDPIFATI